MLNVDTSTPDRVVGLRCEGAENPNLVETPCPRFSWKIESGRRGAKQSAYRLRLKSFPGAEEVLWDSGVLESAESQWVIASGLRLAARTSYVWQVRVWDERGRASRWSEFSSLQTGLMGGEWPADWISDGRVVEVGEAPPARYFRTDFSIPQKCIRAVLYFSAFGIVKPWINGECISEDCFAPGWPDYRKRVFYVSYDVTDALQEGVNTLGLMLGDGWYSGTLFLDHQYGSTPKLSAWIELSFEDGSIQRVATGENWKWKTGPIVEHGIYFGETHDARLEDLNWSRPRALDDAWKAVKVEETPDVSIDARLSEPVRRIEELKPMGCARNASGAFIYDLGQNMVGWVRLRVEAEAGDDITLRFAEMLEKDGSIHTANLRTAKATARYIAKGGSEVEIWEPCFTYFGFRYVELTGVKEPFADAITGVVVHTDLKRMGRFECSNPLLNQLYSNTLWGQKGNFLELPTDCPQRDERLGWTGDAQVFCNTALYNMDASNFYRQWLAAVRDSFEPGPEGGFGSVAPYTGFARGSAGWADGGAVVPWTAWLHSGDRAILEENFPVVCEWVDLMRESAPDGIRISKEGWGDWLAPWYPQLEAPTPYRMIATAYYAYSTQIAIWMAEELGEFERAAEYSVLLAEVKTAFQREYISADGKIESDEQTAYLLALGFDLVQEEKRAAMVEHLVRAIEIKDDHLATGFIGTPLINPVLSSVGHTDLAYKVVLQETYPGWLYSVKNGATTIWERWDSWTPEEGFHPKGMNSFNHYAYGAVVEWFYQTVAGIRLDPKYPGWKRFFIAPELGGGLSYASASLETPYGKIVSSWKQSGDRFEIEVEIPANTTCSITLPVKSCEAVSEKGAPLSIHEAVTDLRVDKGRVSFDMSAGRYHFQAELLTANVR
ncbi:alpha-L-rhamnosidase [Pelagicoccus mobilis]|uniref:alpha-L-rhamnosidase n=1 Tax=Pelagicoccus mobilis TaxID=415221 RepID=A0A934RRW6_9BACT|nr:alpha-L-rhamnosidase [Pelagicoccus mobilis]MBK1876445.1 family 78 glycoside hydrolase catalytic domain [Pelagicoccus mobilis]